MTRIVSHSIAACAALFLSAVTITAIVDIPPQTSLAGIALQTPALA